MSVMSLMSGLEGGPENVDGSGVRWKITAGLVGAERKISYALELVM